VNLKNKGVLLSGIGRSKELIFSRSYFLGGEKKRGAYSLFLPFFFSFLIIWSLNKAVFPRKIFKKNQCHFLVASNIEYS